MKKEIIKKELNNMKYVIHFGKSYPLYLGYDKQYHRIISTNNKKIAYKWLNRLNNCKWVEWTDLQTN